MEGSGMRVFRLCTAGSAMSVIELDDYRPGWVPGIGACGNCGALWAGVTHVSRQFRLECPRCNKMCGTIIPAEAFDSVSVASLREDPACADRFIDNPKEPV